MKKKEIKEFFDIIKPVLLSYEFQQRKSFEHHQNESVYAHSLKVSLLSYKLAKKLKLDEKSAAIGGLLHDFYSEPWQDNKKFDDKKILEKHGFTHAEEALLNSKSIFYKELNPKIENIILRHMFPLNVTPPKYKESWLVTLVDKYVSLSFLKYWPKFMFKKRGD